MSPLQGASGSGPPAGAELTGTERDSSSTRAGTGRPLPYARELAAERRGWYEFVALVRSLEPEECLVSGYYHDPDWTVRDVVAHLGTWLAEAEVQIERMKAGTYEARDVDVDGLNASLLAAMDGQPWDVAWVLARSGRTRMVEEWVGLPGPEDDLAWWIDKAAGTHFDEHLPRLREWVAELYRETQRMITLRPRASIHHTEGGWFHAYWHFSFDFYEDPENTWFGDLRVFNDDTLVPGAVWPMHPHRDIEGVTYVAEGTFEHADSRGNGGILLPGSVQRATLGSGMQHSEGNASQVAPMRFIQMWIIPDRRGLEPSVEQRSFSEDARRGRWLPVLVPAAGYGAADAPVDPDAVTVHQDAAVYATLLDPSQELAHRFRVGFQGYLFVVHGSAHVAGTTDAGELAEGGAAKVTAEPLLSVGAGASGAELLLVETRAIAR